MMQSVLPRLGCLLLITSLMTACSDSRSPVAPELNVPSLRPSQTLTAVGGDLSDGRGTAWRQITATAGLSSSAAAQACPRDGVNPCSGIVGGRDLTGWVWATDAQVVDLIADFEPAIRSNRFLQGAAYDASIAAFFTKFAPTSSGGCFGSGYVITCSFGSFVSGWTSTTNYDGSGVQATVRAGFFAPSSFQVASDANVAASNVTRGLFMWRADGSGGTAIVANDDAGRVESPTNGVAVANVLVNDVLAGAPATLSNVTLRQLSSSRAGIALDATSGAVTVAFGIQPGYQTLTYRMCETARPSNCDDALVSITIGGNIVDAIDDAGATKTSGGVAVANVLANDKFAAGAAALQNVAITSLGGDPALSLNASGAVSVAPQSAAGAYSMSYRMCEIGVPTNCDDAVVRVTVTAYAIDAVDDAGSIQSAPGGIVIANVLANDKFDNGVATLSAVSLLQLSSTNAGLTLDQATGAVRSAFGLAAGYQSLRYRICERAMPGNCDDASVTVTVLPQAYVISNDRQKVEEGKSGSFTVSLSQPISANVTVAVAYLNGTLAVTTNASSLTFTPSTWNVAQTVNYSTIKDSGKDDNAGTIQLVSPGIANGLVVINGTDSDRKTSDPVPVIQSPFNGQTVSGAVSWWGTATSTSLALVDAKFLFKTRDGAFMRVEHATPVKALSRPHRFAGAA